jgi:hypothetical protein
MTLQLQRSVWPDSWLYILIYMLSYYFILAEKGGFEPPLGCLFPKTV